MKKDEIGRESSTHGKVIEHFDRHSSNVLVLYLADTQSSSQRGIKPFNWNFLSPRRQI
jgi:hypothetical protein